MALGAARHVALALLHSSFYPHLGSRPSHIEMASKANPLPLEKTLRDLALIRACEINLSELVPNTQNASDELSEDSSASVERSYEFVKEARAALKLLNREEVEKQGD